MKKTILFAALLAFYFACSPSTDKGASSGNAGMASSSKVDGEKIYKTYCVTCHGLYGDMGGSGAFDLTKSTLPLAERINVITNGRNAMTPFKTLLNEEKIEAVAKYVETLRK